MLWVVESGWIRVGVSRAGWGVEVEVRLKCPGCASVACERSELGRSYRESEMGRSAGQSGGSSVVNRVEGSGSFGVEYFFNW